jgi:hypothetical protein
MADTRNVRQTDDLRLRGLLSGSGMGLGGYMFNSGEEAPSNMPLSAFERGITRAPLSSFNEIDAPDVGDDPMVTGGVEDDIFDMLSQIMVGTQGTIEGLDPETVEMLRGAIDPSAGTEELQAIANAIAEAGGYEAWLEGQETEEVDLEDLGDLVNSEFEPGIPGAPATVGTLPSPGSLPPGTTGGGVVITPRTIGDPSSWPVYVPGTIPGLPSSSTIIGTVEDILSDPEAVLGDIWGQLEDTVSDPLGTLEDILSGVADDGNVTIGAIGAVLNEIRNQGGSDTEGEDLPLGGQGDDDTLILGGNDDDVVDDDVLVGAGGSSFGGGGGGGSGTAVKGSFDDYMHRLSYNPNAPMQVPGGLMTSPSPLATAPKLGSTTTTSSLFGPLLENNFRRVG